MASPDLSFKPKVTGWRRWFGRPSKVQPPERITPIHHHKVTGPSLARGKALLSAKSQATTAVVSDAASSKFTTATELGRSMCTQLDRDTSSSSSSSTNETPGDHSTPASSRDSLDVSAVDASDATKSGVDSKPMVENQPNTRRQEYSMSSVATIACVAPSPGISTRRTAHTKADHAKSATFKGSDIRDAAHDPKPKASMSAIVNIVSTVSFLDTLDSAPRARTINNAGPDATSESPEASGASLSSESPGTSGASLSSESHRTPGEFLSFGFPAPPGVSLVPGSPNPSVVSTAVDASLVPTAATRSSDLVTTSPAPKAKKSVRFATPNRSAVDKVWRKNKEVLANNAMITISAQDSAKLKDFEYENTSLKQDKKDLLLKLSKAENTNKYYEKRVSDLYVMYEKGRGRSIRERSVREKEGTTTKADLEDQLQKTQAAYQNLEETRKQETLALSGEFADFKQKSNAEMAVLRSNYENKVVELSEAQASRDSYQELYENVIARPTQAFSKPNMVAGFHANEQEKKNLKEALDGKTKELSDCHCELVALRVDNGRREREVSELKDEVTKLSSAKDYLEARAVPIKFIGLPYEQQLLMDRKDAKIVELPKTNQILNGTIKKMARAKGGKVDNLLFENHDHVNKILRLKNDALQEENDEKDKELADLRHSIGIDQTFYTNYEIRTEEMKVELHAANDMVRALQLENAKDDADRADPRSWLHMKSCSERAAEAESREQALRSRVDAFKQQEEDYFTLVDCLWRRAFAFEELIDPSQLPAELCHSRRFLRSWTLQSFNHDIDIKDSDQAVETRDEEIARIGFYPGPHDSPDDWISAAAASAGQSVSNHSPAVSHGSSSSSSSSYNTPPSSPASPDGAARDFATSQLAADKDDSDMDPHELIINQQKAIKNLNTLVPFLWNRIWCFEAIVAPWDDYCTQRIREERRVLVKYTGEFAGFEVDRVLTKDELEGLDPAFAPHCTPEAWMPGNYDAGNDSSDDGGNSGDDEDAGADGGEPGDDLGDEEDAEDLEDSDDASSFD